MQAKLSWPQAKALAESGSIVRRAWWLARSIFRTAGDLYWMQWGAKRVALSTDFTLADYNATDWTDTAPEQGHCLQIALQGAITFASATIASGDSVAAVLSVPEPLDEDVVFALSSDQPSITYPATVTILQGSSSVSFTVVGSTTDLASGLVDLMAASTYIGASGSILYNYAPTPLLKATFVLTAANDWNLYNYLPVARITNGPCAAILVIEGGVDDDVVFNGVIYEADHYPFFAYTIPGHQNGAHAFSYSCPLAPGETIEIGTINNGYLGSLHATATLSFSAYNGTATCTTL